MVWSFIRKSIFLPPPLPPKAFTLEGDEILPYAHYSNRSGRFGILKSSNTDAIRYSHKEGGREGGAPYVAKSYLFVANCTIPLLLRFPPSLLSLTSGKRGVSLITSTASWVSFTSGRRSYRERCVPVKSTSRRPNSGSARCTDTRGRWRGPS